MTAHEKKRVCCPSCGSGGSFRKGIQKGEQRHKCLRCGRRLSQSYRRGHHCGSLIKTAVNTYFDTRVAQRTAKSIGYKTGHIQLFRIVGKLGMKLWLVRGYKKTETAGNSLKLMAMHYRFNPFSSCKVKEHNGKSPLNLAGVDSSKLDWVTYSQENPLVFKVP